MPSQPQLSAQNRAFPYAAEEAELARKGWIHANMNPKAAILIGKVVSLLSFALNIVLAYALLKVTLDHGRMRVMIVRVNDVGRAEAVRLDTTWVPEEPELRDQVERFVVRYYTRNPFSIPEAIDALPIYMDAPVYEAWRKDAMDALGQVARGEGLKRVRILSCSILYPNQAKTTGTTARVRIGLDELAPNGAFIGGKTEGWEVTLRFKAGVYPDFVKSDAAKDAWIVRNPLGLKFLEISRVRYLGADVEDIKAERMVEVVRKRAEEEYKREQGLKN